ncbi:DUF4209 domain-containing protein [Mucilaginibacter flavidus]|uniref:DUF4209 domain-containing protein n=1 Tax=Mucilaginibacter flavidus TaxID=2949309 RepID=UPI0020924D34|nr:DUF4209 domain-containing protein [Mucilaginibacter flavidus]MCO5949842.1 DUF4209 domain-containing protein [Mucilaginibacter flavidus]
MTDAASIINHYFTARHGLGYLQLFAEERLKDPELQGPERELFACLEAVLKLGLLNGNSKVKEINEHRPGQETLAELADTTPKIINPYIQAYFYDILQVNKKDKFVNAQKAIDTYLSLIEEDNTLSTKRDRYIRIFRILVGLGKGRHALLDKYVLPVQQEILAADMQHDCYSVTKLVEELIPLQLEPTTYQLFIQKINGAVPLFLASREFEHYRQCNHVLALLVPADAVAYGTEVARAYILEADDYDHRTNALQYMVADLYKKGIRHFQQLEIKNAETEALRKKLVEILKKAAVQHQLIGALPAIPLKKPEFDMPDFNHLFQAVYWLIDREFPSKQEFTDELRGKSDEFLHLKFMGSSMTDEEGNTVAISADNADLIYKDAAMTRDIHCKMLLRPAYDKFSDKYAISEAEVFWLIEHSKFIPPGRLDIYTHGLYHGFCGNFAVAVHLLVPQIENGLRHVLQTYGVITIKLTEEIQTENSLAFYFNHLKGILHEDLLFDLEGLLNESFGNNIRNLVAHGKYATGQFFAPVGFYTWWLALKLGLHLDRYLLKEINPLS